MADTDTRSRSGASPKGVTDTVNDLVDLLKAYAKQETSTRSRASVATSASAWLARCSSPGSLLLTLGLLRLLQTETGTTFTGSWSWVPYVITLAVALIVAAIFLSFIKPSKGRPK